VASHRSAIAPVWQQWWHHHLKHSIACVPPMQRPLPWCPPWQTRAIHPLICSVHARPVCTQFWVVLRCILQYALQTCLRSNTASATMALGAVKILLLLLHHMYIRTYIRLTLCGRLQPTSLVIYAQGLRWTARVRLLGHASQAAQRTVSTLGPAAGKELPGSLACSGHPCLGTPAQAACSTHPAAAQTARW
jgi:hypothetical protein